MGVICPREELDNEFCMVVFDLNSKDWQAFVSVDVLCYVVLVCTCFYTVTSFFPFSSMSSSMFHFTSALPSATSLWFSEWSQTGPTSGH